MGAPFPQKLLPREVYIKGCLDMCRNTVLFKVFNLPAKITLNMLEAILFRRNPLYRRRIFSLRWHNRFEMYENWGRLPPPRCPSPLVKAWSFGTSLDRRGRITTRPCQSVTRFIRRKMKKKKRTIIVAINVWRPRQRTKRVCARIRPNGCSSIAITSGVLLVLSTMRQPAHTVRYLSEQDLRQRRG